MLKPTEITPGDTQKYTEMGLKPLGVPLQEGGVRAREIELNALDVTSYLILS